MSSCRSCGASIIWARTERGKRMPLDAESVADVTAQGLFVLREKTNPEGPLALAAWGLDCFMDPHYRSHFASCPDADSHRNPREQGDQPPQDPGWRHAGQKYRSSAR